MKKPKIDPESTCESRGSAAVRANLLVPLFFQEPCWFGEILEVRPHDVPKPVRRLLDHRSHMTVTMEAFVGGSLGLRVMQERREPVVGETDSEGADSPGRYAREIMLLSPSGTPVQYGIVRVDLRAVAADVRERILVGSAPLGRVLIDAGTLMDVHDVALVRIDIGRELARRIGLEPGCTLFGRVATISLAAGSLPQGFASRTSTTVGFAASPQPSQASRPTIELLEIPLVG